MFRLLFRAVFTAILLSPVPIALADEGHAMGAATTIGALELHDGFARATLPNAPVGGAFVAITNNGATPDRLLSVTTPAADIGQLHEMRMDGEVMKMRQLPDGIVIPAGATVTLDPGGLHIMLMGLKHPLVEGETLALTLTFETAGSIDIDLPVLGTAADAPMQHMDR